VTGSKCTIQQHVGLTRPFPPSAALGALLISSHCHRYPQVEKERRRAAAHAAAEYKKAKQDQGWVGWLWGGGGLRGGGPPPDPDAEEGLRGDLNEEEYAKLEEIVSEQEAAVSQGEFIFPPSPLVPPPLDLR